MKNPILTTLLSVTLAYVIPYVMCSDEQPETDFERCINELKENIRAWEERENGFSKEQFTAVSVVKRGVTIQEILEMYQSLFEIPDQGEKITVLTIKNDHLAESDSLEKCIEYIITAAQNYMYEKRNVTSTNDLCITIECIDKCYVDSYDASNKMFNEIEQTRKDFAAYITDNILELLSRTFRDKIFERIQKYLGNDLLYNFPVSGFGVSDPKRTTEYVKNSYADLVKYTKIFPRQVLSSLENPKHFSDYSSTFDLLKTYINDYEERKGLACFTDNKKAILKFYTFTIDKYEYLFNQNTIDNFSYLQSMVNDAENKTLLEDIFRYSHSKMCQYFQKLPCMRQETFEHKHYKIFDKTLSQDANFVSLSQKYFKKIIPGPRTIADLTRPYRAKSEELLKSLRADNVARIVFKGELDQINLWRLCNILKSTKIIKKLFGHQSIFIDFERAITEDRLNKSYANFRTLSGELKDQIGIEVFATCQATNNDLETNTALLLTYATDTVKAGEHEVCHISTIKVKVSNDTTISIETNSKPSKLSGLATKETEIIYQHRINIKSDHEQITVYVTCYAEDSLYKDKIMLMYEMTRLGEKTRYDAPALSVRTVKFLKNAPVIIYKDLIRKIQLKKIIGTDFIIPNIVSVNGKDYVYAEKMIDESWDELSLYIRKQDGILLRGSGEYKNVSVSKSEIAGFQSSFDCDKPSNLTSFATALNIDAAKLKQIVFEVVINKRIREDATDIQREILLETAVRVIRIFATCDNDHNIILNICEAVESTCTVSPLVHSSSILTKILNDDSYNSLKHLVKETENYYRLNTIISDMIIDIYKKKDSYEYYDSKLGLFEQKAQYIDMFSMWILDLNRQEPSFSDVNETKRDMKYCSALHQYACISKISGLIDKILEEIYNVVNSYEVKVTSINTCEKTDYRPESSRRFCAIS